MEYLKVILLIVLCLFVSLIVILVLVRGTTRRLIKDLGLARHIFVTWFLAPFFRAYFWLLEKLRKVQVRVNSPIPWEEPSIIVVANHGMPKMQDTFLLPVIIFFDKPKNYFNPIRYFPKSTADEVNFVKSWFFRLIVGDERLISVNRNLKNKVVSRSPLSIEEAKKDFEEYGGIEIIYIEGRRTKTAIGRGRIKKWVAPEGEELILGRPGLGAAKLALETNTPIVPVWGMIKGDNSYPQASVWVVLLGLLELLFNYKVKAAIDINHPAGPIRPKPGETLRELTQRIEDALFEVGGGQLKRLKSKR